MVQAVVRDVYWYTDIFALQLAKGGKGGAGDSPKLINWSPLACTYRIVLESLAYPL